MELKAKQNKQKNLTHFYFLYRHCVRQNTIFWLQTAIGTLFPPWNLMNAVKLTKHEKEEVTGERARTTENQLSKLDTQPAGIGFALANQRGKGLSLPEDREDPDAHQKSLHWLRNSKGWLQSRWGRVDAAKWMPHPHPTPLYFCIALRSEKQIHSSPSRKGEPYRP